MPGLLWIIANTIVLGLGGAALDAWGAIGIPLLAIFLGVGQWLCLRPFLELRRRWMVLDVAGIFASWIAAAVVGVVSGTVILFSVAMVGRAFAAIGLELPFNPTLFYGVFNRVVASLGGACAGAVVGACQVITISQSQASRQSWISASVIGGAVAAAVIGLDLYLRALERTVEMLGQVSVARSTTADGVLLRFANGALSGSVFGALYSIITAISIGSLIAHRARQ